MPLNEMLILSYECQTGSNSLRSGLMLSTFHLDRIPLNISSTCRIEDNGYAVCSLQSVLSQLVLSIIKNSCEL